MVVIFGVGYEKIKNDNIGISYNGSTIDFESIGKSSILFIPV